MCLSAVGGFAVSFQASLFFLSIPCLTGLLENRGRIKSTQLKSRNSSMITRWDLKSSTFIMWWWDRFCIFTIAAWQSPGAQMVDPQKRHQNGLMIWVWRAGDKLLVGLVARQCGWAHMLSLHLPGGQMSAMLKHKWQPAMYPGCRNCHFEGQWSAVRYVSFVFAATRLGWHVSWENYSWLTPNVTHFSFTGALPSAKYNPGPLAWRSELWSTSSLRYINSPAERIKQTCQ
jgi:hypothetical protein